MQTEGKQLILAYDISASTESNITATADMLGVGQIFIGVKGNIGTVNDASETMSILVNVRDFTATENGSTAYSAVVDTDDLAAWTLTSSAGTDTSKSLLLNRSNMQTGARWLQIIVNNSATGTASESWVSVVGLMPEDATTANYVA